jgi:hypothetical protein
MPRVNPPESDVWLLCSACRKGIAFGAVHWVCSVSTCNRSRTRLVFCSVPCWDSHLATLRHREAWAVEERAPGRLEHARQQADEAREPAPAAPARAPVPTPRLDQPPPLPARPAAESVTAHAGGPALSSSYDHQDVLIVISKVKKYIRERSGMNTSDGIVEALGDHVRTICDEAIRAAARDGRKTVLDRDVPKVRR